MFPASCFLLWLAVVETHQNIMTYVKPWEPFRRTAGGCEMCDNGHCVTTDEPRCEYYAEASKLMSDDDGLEKTEIHQDDLKIDAMLFELVDSASSSSQFQDCIPLVSQYTDCTEENICSGCKFCSCNEVGKWICNEKQKCRQEPKLSVDHRVIGIVIENLKRKENSQQKRGKRSARNTISKKMNDKMTYNDISNWMYEIEPLNHDHNKMNIDNILGYIKSSNAAVDKDIDQDPVLSNSDIFFTTETSITKNDYVDLLEFQDILQSLTINDLNTKKPFKVVDPAQTFAKQRSEENHVNDVNYIEFDPLRLIKRDTSNIENNKNHTVLQINATSNNFTYEIIFTEALQGLNKTINEKQQELKELMNIRNKLLIIAKAHNIDITVNSTVARIDSNKNHIAIYKLDTIEQSVAKVKHEICSALENEIKKDVSNSSGFHQDLKMFFDAFRNLIVQGNNKIFDAKTNILSSQEREQNPRRHIFLENRYENNKPMEHIRYILVEINKASTNPLHKLSQYTRKILKRVIKQLYLDDFAIIDFIVHETYYDFDNYLENIGSKWTKLLQDFANSPVFNSRYRIKLLHLTLKADINKMEDMITLLDFARNRRMTVANGFTIDKSLLRIQNNLKLIDSNVQKIMRLEKNKWMRKVPAVQNIKTFKKKSIIQKLKNMFQNSKNDIKDMLRKRFPKSEIMKKIAKKKVEELQKQRMLEYQETMKHWQDNLNLVPRREKRSIWRFQAFTDRIKSIIPGYLKGKVKPAIQKKKSENKTQTKRTHGRKKKRYTTPTTVTMTVSRRSTKTYRG